MRTLDYDAIYGLEAPPPYEPWAIYGAFLRAAVTGQAELVFDDKVTVPSRVRKISDIVFKVVDGHQIELDIYQARDDQTPRPLVIYIHGGYWKAGTKLEGPRICPFP